MFPVMPKPTPEELPNRVREWRLRRELTLRDVAKEIGLAHGSVQRIETGVRELNQFWMEKLAELFQCQPADLLRTDLGGLNDRERSIIDTYRQIPELNRRMVDSVMEAQQQWRGAPEVTDLNPDRKLA